MERLLLTTGDKFPSLECSDRQGRRRILRSSSGMGFCNGMIISLLSAPYGKYGPSVKSKPSQSIRSQACARNCDVPDLMRRQWSQLVAVDHPQHADDGLIWQDRRYATVADPNMDFTCRCGARQSIPLVPASACAVSVQPETGAKHVACVTVLAWALDTSAITDFTLATTFCTPAQNQSKLASQGSGKSCCAARAA
jgi:hypothetical protein